VNELISLCKRRGFIFQASEIYGGINGFWDYGPMGVELKKAIKDHWWNEMVRMRDDVVGQDATLISHPKVWEASGHVANFTDPMVDCRKCKGRWRADQMDDVKKCKEGGDHDFTAPQQFNLMFKTYVGASEDSASLAFLRPETCQAIFCNFKQIQTVARMKVPFGIAQVGKAFRNEINPRNFIFRSREFEQMEMEFFCHPNESMKWLDYWKEERFNWYVGLGIQKEKLRLRPHAQNELAHYAKAAFDVEYEFPFGWQELEGIAHRGNWDLSRHAQYSGKDQEYFDDQTRERFVPEVIEPSAGVDRTLLTLLIDAYEVEQVVDEETKKSEDRVVLRLSPIVAPRQVAVFPLSKKLADKAMPLEKSLRREFRSDYDDAGAIGRRYRRQDEAGTPFCVTFDFESEKDESVTIRDRDTMLQERVKIADLKAELRKRMDAWKRVKTAGATLGANRLKDDAAK
jgi:glycyl-tRNA synthetase